MKINILSATQLGVESLPVSVETEIIGSTKRFSIIGLPDNILKESRDRVRCAIENSGFSFPNREVIVSLSPAALPKKGAGFDLPIALSVLAACGYLPIERLGKYLAFSELKLDGSLKDLSGTLAAYVLARKLKRQFLTSSEYLKRHLELGDSKCITLNNLEEAVELLKTGKEPFVDLGSKDLREPQVKNTELDFSDVIGQFAAKRAMELSAAGGHNVLFIGPPGAGKSMIAERSVSLLQPLSLEEKVEVSQVQESIGFAEPKSLNRPFRAPHHTTSYAGLIGGGSFPSPGEISLAHRGVLFLDELPEFRKDVLETLRQPLEKKEVLISRAKMQLKFPANFTLIAAMNPCPCGRLGNEGLKNKYLKGDSYIKNAPQPCKCSPEMIRRYSSRISGPLLDRIDMFLWLRAIPVEELSFKEASAENPTHKMQERVRAASFLQKERFKSPYKKNSSMNAKDIAKFCKLSPDSSSFLKKEAKRLEMSTRAYVRILRLSRTIADLENSQEIKAEHLAEAIRYKAPPEVFR